MSNDSKPQPTGWVVVDFADDVATFLDSRDWHAKTWPPKLFASREDAEDGRLDSRYCDSSEVHPWPLPASVLARLKAKHPGQDWSQVPVADAPVEKLGRWVIESLRPVTDHRYRDKADWHGTADRVSLPWKRLADVQGFMQRNYWSPLDYRVVNLDDLPSPAVAEPSEVERLRADVEKLTRERDEHRGEADVLRKDLAAYADQLCAIWALLPDDIAAQGGPAASAVRGFIDRLTRERDEARAELAKVTEQRNEIEQELFGYAEDREVVADAKRARRDEFAKAALTGLLADPEGSGDHEFFADEAVLFADATIRALDATIRALDGAGGA